MGTSDTAVLDTIRKRFAGREAAVEQAFQDSESFRGLCSDYVACAQALARWQKASSAEASLRSGEYSELLSELARELEARLRAGERRGRVR